MYKFSKDFPPRHVPIFEWFPFPRHVPTFERLQMFEWFSPPPRHVQFFERFLPSLDIYKCSKDLPPAMYQLSKDFLPHRSPTCTNFRQISCSIAPRHVQIFDSLLATSLPRDIPKIRKMHCHIACTNFQKIPCLIAPPTCRSFRKSSCHIVPPTCTNIRTILCLIAPPICTN